MRTLLSSRLQYKHKAKLVQEKRKKMDIIKIKLFGTID